MKRIVAVIALAADKFSKCNPKVGCWKVWKNGQFVCKFCGH